MRKFNIGRLHTLIFWVVHSTATLILALGFFKLYNYESFEGRMLEGASSCKWGSIESQITCSGHYYGFISDWGEQMFYSFVIGFSLIIVYWVVRGIYRYLFPKEESKVV